MARCSYCNGQHPEHDCRGVGRIICAMCARPQRDHDRGEFCARIGEPTTPTKGDRRNPRRR